jgi:hypothetical protein
MIKVLFRRVTLLTGIVGGGKLGGGKSSGSSFGNGGDSWGSGGDSFGGGGNSPSGGSFGKSASPGKSSGGSFGKATPKPAPVAAETFGEEAGGEEAGEVEVAAPMEVAAPTPKGGRNDPGADNVIQNGLVGGGGLGGLGGLGGKSSGKSSGGLGSLGKLGMSTVDYKHCHLMKRDCANLPRRRWFNWRYVFSCMSFSLASLMEPSRPIRKQARNYVRNFIPDHKLIALGSLGKLGGGKSSGGSSKLGSGSGKLGGGKGKRGGGGDSFGSSGDSFGSSSS